MVMLRLTAEQYKKLPILVDESSCFGKTYVITGGNSGLGLETARHLVAASAQKVVLAVRNLKAGEAAKADIEKSTGRKGVVEIRHLDMSTYGGAQKFADSISAELDRIDGFVCNAGIMVDHWELFEGIESSIFVNVVNTIFLAALMMPKLTESSRKFGIQPTLEFVVSVFGYTAKAELDKSRQGKFFDSINDEKKCALSQRYALTKLVLEHALRHFAVLCPVERTGVKIAMVAPGLCSTGLGRDASTLTKVMHETLRVVFAKSAEMGSRTYIHGLVVGPEGHGKLLSGCQIKENWVPKWIVNEDGKTLQKKIWDELAVLLEKQQAGCVSRLM